MRHIRTAILLALGLGGLSGCADHRVQVGFSLPEGNAERGREAFVYLQCHSCHTVSGLELPREPHPPEPPFVELGGPVVQVKTYDQLIAAIINPSHELAEGYPADVVSEDGDSRMPVYNQVMTVQELIDIVTFLQPLYEVVAPEYSYPRY